MVVPKITIHVPDHIQDQMEREITRRGTTRSGFWVEAAKLALEASSSRSSFYQAMAAAVRNDGFVDHQRESRAAHRLRETIPVFEDDTIEVPGHLR